MILLHDVAGEGLVGVDVGKSVQKSIGIDLIDKDKTVGERAAPGGVTRYHKEQDRRQHVTHDCQ